jgi:hypothetical protein
MMYKLKLVATLSLLLSIPFIIATDLSLVEQPLFTSAPAKPMMMLVMGRDHTLFYEEYNDASDLNNYGDLDITFTPSIILVPPLILAQLVHQHYASNKIRQTSEMIGESGIGPQKRVPF